MRRLRCYYYGQTKIKYKNVIGDKLSLRSDEKSFIKYQNRHFKHSTNEEKLELITKVLTEPELYLDHGILAILAHKLISKPMQDSFKVFDLEDEPKHFDVFGSKHIELNAIKQMELAMRLPIAAKGALMPDAMPT